MFLTLHFSVVNNLSSQSKTTHILFEMCAEFFPEMKKQNVPRYVYPSTLVRTLNGSSCLNWRNFNKIRVDLILFKICIVNYIVIKFEIKST